jgi:hypothetical protein
MRARSALAMSFSRRAFCLISVGAFEQRFEIAIGIDELGGCLDANAGDAGHVIDRCRRKAPARR